ncbi:MAG: anthranilate synthase component I family protein [bacterium]|nr:anthranilate synthase component I family protein [bacterium]
MNDFSATYEATRAAHLEEIRDLLQQPGSIWLDSSLTLGDKGRNSYLLHKPVLDIGIGGGLSLNDCAPEQISCSSIDDLLTHLDKQWSDPSLFSAGYFGYESTLPLLGLRSTVAVTSDLDRLPQARFLFYDRESLLELDPNDFSPSTMIHRPTSPKCAELVAGPERIDYEAKVKAIKEHIHEGDIYQANYTSRYVATGESDPLTTYLRLRQLNPAPYSAYLNFGDYQILSSSPERMFRRAGQRVVTSPIKGTIARGSNPTETARNLERLLNSDKDRAELLMIIDLARNDLGRVARTGTVNINQLFKSELYSSVIHLFSDITANIDPDLPTSELVRALLPGGSITGAPKRRAVEILLQYESRRRNVYTGCIGYVHGGEAEFNIGIRTILHRRGEYHIHAGGGIVADSSPSAEYDEMRLKAANLLRAVGLNESETKS